MRVGENDITKEVDCRVWNADEDCAPLPQDIKVDQLKSVIHPEYSNRYKTSDIALLKLVKAAVLGFSKFAHTARLKKYLLLFEI